MIRLRSCLPLVVILLWIGAGCSPQATASPTATRDLLRPFASSTPDDASAQSPSATPQLVFPTPTPLTYTVVEGDNLNGHTHRHIPQGDTSSRALTPGLF